MPKNQEKIKPVPIAAKWLEYWFFNGATVLIGLMEKSHKHKGFEQSINSINLNSKHFKR